MSWQIIVALVIIIPLILIPVVFVWFLNMGGLRALTKGAREKQLAREESVSTVKPK